MDLKDSIYYRCLLQDIDNCKRSIIPFLISTDNNIDPGIVPSYLLELTQVEEIVIVQAYI